jgi:predicted adenylyl cyclase CyaB
MNNIEIKFTVHSLNRIEQLLMEQPDCRFLQTLHQADTYFQAPEGRLKLRTQKPGEGELIFYQRENLNRPRESNYLICITENPRQLAAILTSALGTTATVIKERRLWMFRNVRIHLDRVEGLGEFIEFEAVIDEQHDRHTSAQNLDEILHKFSDFSLTPVAESYIDLRIRKEP